MAYAKAVVAVLTAAALAAQSALTDGTISGQEWVTVLIAALGALAVYAVPNSPAVGRHEK